MGMFLKKELGKDYFAIGQFFGKGSFSAAIIDEQQPDWTNRKLGSIDIDQIWDNSLEATLQRISSAPYYLNASQFADYPALTKTQWARSFGWGLKLSELDQIAERINIPLDFDAFTYFPTAAHSLPHWLHKKSCEACLLVPATKFSKSTYTIVGIFQCRSSLGRTVWLCTSIDAFVILLGWSYERPPA